MRARIIPGTGWPASAGTRLRPSFLIPEIAYMRGAIFHLDHTLGQMGVRGFRLSAIIKAI